MSFLVSQAEPSFHLQSRSNKDQYTMSVETTFKLLQLMFRKLDLDILQVIQFEL